MSKKTIKIEGDQIKALITFGVLPADTPEDAIVEITVTREEKVEPELVPLPGRGSTGTTKDLHLELVGLIAPKIIDYTDLYNFIYSVFEVRLVDNSPIGTDLVYNKILPRFEQLKGRNTLIPELEMGLAGFYANSFLEDVIPDLVRRLIIDWGKPGVNPEFKVYLNELFGGRLV